MVDQWTIDRLAALVGQSVAAGLLLTVDRCSGERAHQVGLVHRLGEVGEALGWAAEIAGLAPLTIAGHKIGLEAVAARQPADPRFREAFERAWGSADLREGLAAFGERRHPEFRGE
jgi:enoyl-CoA hydratase